jgi:ribosomal-protein-alanine N-acetyltransferase
MEPNTITLRPWRETDLDNVAVYANNYHIASKHMNVFPYPYARENAEEFFRRIKPANPANILAITLNDQFVGSIGLHFQSDIFFRNAELGYWVAEPYWGRGFATDAIGKMVNYGFENWDFLQRIFARPFGSNLASQRVLEKAGFEFEARLQGTIFKNNTVEDELIYAIRRKV